MSWQASGLRSSVLQRFNLTATGLAATLTVALIVGGWLWNASARAEGERATDAAQDRAISALRRADDEQTRRYDVLIDKVDRVAQDARETRGMARALLAGRGQRWAR